MTLRGVAGRQSRSRAALWLAGLGLSRSRITASFPRQQNRKHGKLLETGNNEGRSPNPPDRNRLSELIGRSSSCCRSALPPRPPPKWRLVGFGANATNKQPPLLRDQRGAAQLLESRCQGERRCAGQHGGSGREAEPGRELAGGWRAARGRRRPVARPGPRVTSVLPHFQIRLLN